MSQAQAAKALGVSKVSVSNWERDVHPPEEARLRDIAELYQTTPAVLRYGEPGQGDAPTGEEPAGARVEGRSADYWAGRQDALLDMMQFASRLQRQAAEWQDKAIQAQRELLANTVPIPTDEARDLRERGARFLEDMKKARAELDARAEEEAAKKRRNAS